MGKHKAGGKATQEAGAVQDPRFAGVHTDPRFIKPKKRNQKVVLDDRFKSVFEGEDGKGKVDRFGRKLAKSAAQDELKRFYRIDDEDGKKRAGPGDKDFIDFARGQVMLESSDEEGEDEEEAEGGEEDSESEGGEVELGPSRARKQREVSIDLDESAPFAFLDDDGPNDGPPVEPTNRIAVIDMDWDHLRATDLFQVFSSLLSLTAPPLSQLPPKREFVADENGELVKGVREVHRVARGRVVRVAIYKSSFGKERMAKEDVEGPPAEIFKSGHVAPPSETDDSGDEDEGRGTDDGDSVSDLFREDEQQDYDEDALRQYQLDRLRYHYAVVTLDSVEAARHVYEEVEGSEFERTANIFDLSYVPEGLPFEETDLRDECLEERSDYKGVDYVTDALRHSKVKLTWDAEDPHRAKVTRLNTQKLSRNELAAVDYDAFIAPPSSDEDEGEGEGDAGKVDQAKRDRMRKLMGLDVGAQKDADGGMVITFAPALDEGGREGENAGEETSLDVYKRKEKERRQRKKAGKNGIVEGPTVVEEDAGFDDDFFKNADDGAAFADRDAGAASSDEGEGRPKKKKLGREERKAAKVEAERQRAELAEALGSDDESGGEGGKHFNMNDIVKAEKLKGKKRMKGAKAKRLGELKDEFAIDAGDERFKSVFEEADFAIDPSNPHFKKTKNMDKLLETGQKRRAVKRERDERERDKRKAEGKDSAAAVNGDGELSSLVASLKRKSGGAGTTEEGAKRRKA